MPQKIIVRFISKGFCFNHTKVYVYTKEVPESTIKIQEFSPKTFVL